MTTDYIENFRNIIHFISFVSFKGIVITLTILLIVSLIILAIGCLIKSQKIKSKFLTSSISLLFGIVVFLCIPFFIVYFKNLI